MKNGTMIERWLDSDSAPKRGFVMGRKNRAVESAEKNKKQEIDHKKTYFQYRCKGEFDSDYSDTDCSLPYNTLMSKEVEGSAAEALPDDLPDADLKIILLGDSAVGKSKLVERYLMDEYNPRQLSTYALTLYRKNVKLDDTGEAIR